MEGPMPLTIGEILTAVQNGDLSVLTSDNVNTINHLAMMVIQADSENRLDADGQTVLDMILAISNILYNNTTLEVLPLDDGIYDMLMIIVKKYNPNYQVGAMPVSFKNRDPEESKTIFNPFVEYDDRLNKTLYGNDFKYVWGYQSPHLLEDKIKSNKKLRDTSHNYPELVGTLDKCKFVTTMDAVNKGMQNANSVEILQRDFFEKHISMGLYGPHTPITVIAELKYDGISIEADVSNRVLGARTRGDTNNDKATDYTPILEGYPFPNSQVPDNEAFGMKFEAILSNAALRELSYTYGKTYANARNAVNGLLSGTDGRKWRDFITLVPLAASISQKMGMNRAEEIEFLNKYYFNSSDKIYYQIMQGDYMSILYQIHDFAKSAEYARPSMPFLYDGIVISYMDPYIINALGRQNSVNKWQMAVKFETMRKETIFLGYGYTVGQNGVVTPMIYFKPIEFYGCIHNHASGHSYARFKELGLRYGDRIIVDYVNDVMPYVMKKSECQENYSNTNPIIQFPINCPFCGAPIYTSDKSAVCSNPKCLERNVARATNMLQKLHFKGFSEATVRKLRISSFVDLVSIPLQNVLPVLKDKTTANFEKQRQRLLSDTVYDYQIIGSLGFEDIAETTWQNILKNISLEDILSLGDGQLYCHLTNIKGIGDSIAQTIIGERSIYLDDLKYVATMPNVVRTFGQSRMLQIRFTGCRDSELMKDLAQRGYDCKDANVTKNTDVLLVPYYGYTSTKVNAISQWCTIVPITEFRKNPLGILSDIAAKRYGYPSFGGGY